MAIPITAHVPVLLEEILEWANLASNSRIVDGTLGGGGHARGFLSRLGSDGLFIGLDRDPTAVERTADALRTEYPEAIDSKRCRLLPGSYIEIPRSTPRA